MSDQLELVMIFKDQISTLPQEVQEKIARLHGEMKAIVDRNRDDGTGYLALALLSVETSAGVGRNHETR